MLLLCYLPQEMPASARLRRQLQGLPGLEGLETVPDITQLAHRLQQPRPQALLCLALLPTQQALKDLLALQELLRDIPLVLALPDEAPQSLLWAHRLRPRYLTFAHGPEANLRITQVVARMLGKYARPWDPPADSPAKPALPGGPRH